MGTKSKRTGTKVTDRNTTLRSSNYT